MGSVFFDIKSVICTIKSPAMKYYLTVLFTFLTVALLAQDYKLEGNEVKVSKPVLFKPESNEALEIIRQYLAGKSYISLLRIESHTDKSGDADYDQNLSQKRAMAVCSRLVKLGVDCKRLVAVGFGDTKPVADNATMAGRAKNQRISFVNAALNGKSIGGLPADGGGSISGDPCN